jgi:hypothetical protein
MKLLIMQFSSNLLSFYGSSAPNILLNTLFSNNVSGGILTSRGNPMKVSEKQLE